MPEDKCEKFGKAKVPLSPISNVFLQVCPIGQAYLLNPISQHIVLSSSFLTRLTRDSKIVMVSST